MLKNNKGITMMMLVVTVIVLIILTGVSVQTGKVSTRDTKVARKVADMKLVKAKVEVIYEQNRFNGESLIGVNEVEWFTDDLDIELSEEEKNLIVKDRNEKDMSKWLWYMWDREILMSQGLDPNMLSDNQYYFVNYATGEILYTAGTIYDNQKYYSLTGLEAMLAENY